MTAWFKCSVLDRWIVWAVSLAAATGGLALLATRSSEAVAVPDGVVITGHLETSSGAPAAAGTYNIRAAVFEEETGGTELCNWLETGVAVHRGNVQVHVGGRSGAGTCRDVADQLRNHGDLWVELSVQTGASAFERLDPRIPVGAAARAHHAEVAETASTDLALQLVPVGAVGLFEAECPPGWTRAAEFDGRFPRGAATAGSTGGGPDTTAAGGHDHSIGVGGAHAHGALHGVGHHAHGMDCWSGIGSVKGCSGWGVPGDCCHSERLCGSYADQGAHAHDTNAVGDHPVHPVATAGEHVHGFVPPYGEFIFCRKM